MMSPSAFPDLLPFDSAEIRIMIESFLQIFLLGLFVCGIVGIVWAIFEKASDYKYTVPKMISTIFFNVILIFVSLYCSYYFLDNPIIGIF